MVLYLFFVVLAPEVPHVVILCLICMLVIGTVLSVAVDLNFTLIMIF